MIRINWRMHAHNKNNYARRCLPFPGKTVSIESLAVHIIHIRSTTMLHCT